MELSDGLPVEATSSHQNLANPEMVEDLWSDNGRKDLTTLKDSNTSEASTATFVHTRTSVSVLTARATRTPRELKSTCGDATKARTNSGTSSHQRVTTTQLDPQASSLVRSSRSNLAWEETESSTTTSTWDMVSTDSESEDQEVTPESGSYTTRRPRPSDLLIEKAGPFLTNTTKVS